MEEGQVDRTLVVDLRKTCALVFPVSSQILIVSNYYSGFGEERALVRFYLTCSLEELTPPTSSAIIQDIMALQDAGQATIAYFYFDFRDTDKRDLCNALASLLTQLSAYSDSYWEILSHVHQAHYNGADGPSTETRTTCFKDMLALPDHGPVYIILDALDECSNSPNTSGLRSAREEVLDFLKDLVDLQLPNLHICVTSRPELDIRTTLEPLASYSVSVHDQNGQKKDIESYIRAVVYADSDTAMEKWSEQDKEWVVDALGERADGM